MKSCAYRMTFAAIVFIGGSALAVPAPGAEETETDGGTTYSKNGKTYTVRHVFQSSCRTEELLAICFEFKHLQKFYRASKVRLLESGPDWQKVEYRADYTICSSTAVYKKTLTRTQGKVLFTLLNCQVSGWGMPGMSASSGGYTVTDDGKNRTLTYEQSVTLDREIGALDWSLIKSETKTFFADFEAYVQQQQDTSPRLTPTVPEKKPAPPTRPPELPMTRNPK